MLFTSQWGTESIKYTRALKDDYTQKKKFKLAEYEKKELERVSRKTGQTFTY
jgi:hypothetical protein